MRARDDSRVRPIEDADISAAEALLLEAYGRPMSMSLRTRIRAAGSEWLVADCGAALAGIVSAARYGAVAYVGTMGVSPRLQRRGIATALMETLIERAEAAGVATLLLDATDAGAPLYEKFGFVDLDRTDVYERDLREPRERILRNDCDPADLARAIALDRAVMGCDRSGVLTALAGESGSWLATRDDAYAMAHGAVIGPWAAASERSARDLFALARRRRPHAARVFSPASNRFAATLLRSEGFVRMRALRHMSRGAPSPVRRNLIYGQASLGHG